MSASRPTKSPESFSSTEETKSNAVGFYNGDLGEAGPTDSMERSVLPRPLEQTVLSYLASDVDADPERYSETQLAEFKLFGRPLATANQVANLIACGARTEAIKLITRNRATLHCIASLRDGFGEGRQASGTPLTLAVIMGDTVLADKIKTILSPAEANVQLQALFSPGWEEEQKERDDRYINAYLQFQDHILRNRLPENTTYAHALSERKEVVSEYRLALRPKRDDKVITRGFMVNPEIYSRVRKLILQTRLYETAENCFDLDFLWNVGFHSLLGAGTPTMMQLLEGGIDRYFQPRYFQPNNIEYLDETPFYDPNPHVGLGITFFINADGQKLKPNKDERINTRLSTWFEDKLYKQATSFIPATCSFKPSF